MEMWFFCPLLKKSIGNPYLLFAGAPMKKSKNLVSPPRRALLGHAVKICVWLKETDGQTYRLPLVVLSAAVAAKNESHQDKKFLLLSEKYCNNPEISSDFGLKSPSLYTIHTECPRSLVNFYSVSILSIA